jgi:hypothetical protein
MARPWRADVRSRAPLLRMVGRLCFPSVQIVVDETAPSAMRLGWISGLLGGAAALGALVVFSRRDQAPLFDPNVGPPIGAFLHLVLSLLWGFVFGIIAAPLRGIRVLAVAFLTSGAAWALSATLLPPALRLGNGLYASLPRAATVYVLFALAMASGMRLARR